MSQNILGVVPARAGSKGIPRKNLLTLGGKTLLELAIESARESRLLTRTIVSTEDEELAEVARECGAEVPFLRPSELASDTASVWSAMRHAVAYLAEREGWKADTAVILQPTTPFRRGEHIDATVQVLLDTGAESAMTVREVDYPPHWMLRMDNEGRLSRLIDDSHDYSRRQDTPKVYQPAGMVYAVRNGVLGRANMYSTEYARGVPVSFEDSVNIDEWWQYRLAQLLWKERVR